MFELLMNLTTWYFCRLRWIAISLHILSVYTVHLTRYDFYSSTSILFSLSYVSYLFFSPCSFIYLDISEWLMDVCIHLHILMLKMSKHLPGDAHSQHILKNTNTQNLYLTSNMTHNFTFVPLIGNFFSQITPFLWV